jgi:hypothetical protein
MASTFPNRARTKDDQFPRISFGESITCRSRPRVDESVLIAGEEVGRANIIGVEETCAAEAGSGWDSYKIIDNLNAWSMHGIILDLVKPGFAAAATKCVMVVMGIVDGRKEASITLGEEMDFNLYSANDVWKEVLVRGMFTISGRIKTRVVPYCYEAGTSKFACTPDELRPNPTG